MKVKLFATIALVVIPTLAYAAGGAGAGGAGGAGGGAAGGASSGGSNGSSSAGNGNNAAPTMAVGRVAQPALTAARVTAITVALTAQQAAGPVPAQAAATLTRPERATAAATRWATPISLRARTESRKSRHNIGASSRFNIRNAPSRAGRFPLNKVRDPEARPALTKGHGVGVAAAVPIAQWRSDVLPHVDIKTALHFAA